MGNWHIITGEYPPHAGGVSDYTSLVANALASAEDTIHVWAARCGPATSNTTGVQVHKLQDHFGPRALALLNSSLRKEPQGEILVQYVPHAFGFKAMNLPFCLWLNSIPQERLTVMFHEVAFPVQAAQAFKHNLLGLVTRTMARIVSRSAGRIMVASQRWRTMLRGLGVTAPISWVPIPSTIPVFRNAVATAQWRQRCTRASGPLVGHFADCSDYAVKQLSHLIPAILVARPDASVLFLGRNSGELRRRLVSNSHHLNENIHATGLLPAPELSAALAACDVMVQPYPDGVSTRRSTTSALLAHGCAIVTTKGVATERLWSDSGAVGLVPANNPEGLEHKIALLLANPELWHTYGAKSLELYDSKFALRHTIAALLENDNSRYNKEDSCRILRDGLPNKFKQWME